MSSKKSYVQELFTNSNMEVSILQAFHGDSIWISFKDKENVPKNILIDSGPGNTFSFKNKKGKQENGGLKILIEKLRNKDQYIDLLILTHIDDDHIGGVLKWFNHDEEAKNMVKKVWFNSGELISEYFRDEHAEDNTVVLRETSGLNTSIRQGVKFEDFLEANNLWERVIFKSLKKKEIFGVNFIFLSPDEKKLKSLLGKWEIEAPITDTSGITDYNISLQEHITKDIFEEDRATHNGSSIGFIMEYNQKNGVFLADSHPLQIVESLRALGYSKKEPLKAEFLKISHHGSKANTNYELLELIKTENYIISTNGERHQLPNKQCLARIINFNNDAKIYFNYPERISQIFMNKDCEDFPNFQALSTKNGFIL